MLTAGPLTPISKVSIQDGNSPQYVQVRIGFLVVVGGIITLDDHSIVYTFNIAALYIYQIISQYFYRWRKGLTVPVLIIWIVFIQCYNLQVFLSIISISGWLAVSPRVAYTKQYTIIHTVSLVVSWSGS